MMRSSHSNAYTFLVLILSRLLSITYAAKCLSPPIVLPYRNASIAPSLLVQGISISIGTPPQQIVLTPSLMLENTFIPRYTNSCIQYNTTEHSIGNSTRRAVMIGRRNGGLGPGSFEEPVSWKGEGSSYMRCAELYGGGYEPTQSSSFHENKTVEQKILELESLLQRTNFTDWSFVYETITFTDYLSAYATSTSASSLPEHWNLTTSMILPHNTTAFGTLGRSPLGLTPNSTILAALTNASMIPSTSWSLTPHTLCLGCIDDSLSKGSFHTFKPSDRTANPKLPCLIQVQVEALNWHSGKGIEGVSLINGSFTACIEPGVKFLVLPDGVSEALGRVTERGVMSQFEDFVAFKGKPGGEGGKLMFKIKGGLEVNVTIPGAGKADGDDGEWKVPIGKGGWGSYGRGVWVLGKLFTDRVVLKWDAVAEEYEIANVNDEEGGKEDLKPLGCDGFPEAKGKAKESPATATIIGTVVGGFVGGVVSVLAALWFFRRGEKGAKAKYEPMGSEEALPMGAIPSDRRTLDSLREGMASAASVRTERSARSAWTSRRPAGQVSPEMDPQLVEDNSIYEAPEGGTAYPTKRTRPELGIPSVYRDHR